MTPMVTHMTHKIRTQIEDSTAFSDFIRNASAGRKKRVYASVLKESTDKQNALLEKCNRLPTQTT